MGHEDAFPPATLSNRFRLGKPTFARTRGNEQDAPIPDLPALTPERGGSTISTEGACPSSACITRKIGDELNKKGTCRAINAGRF